MIHFRAEYEGRTILFLGLSYRDIEQLMGGDGLRVDGRRYGFAGEIVIIAGQDEASMADRFTAAGFALHPRPKADPNPT